MIPNLVQTRIQIWVNLGADRDFTDFRFSWNSYLVDRLLDMTKEGGTESAWAYVAYQQKNQRSTKRSTNERPITNISADYVEEREVKRIDQGSGLVFGAVVKSLLTVDKTLETKARKSS